MARLLQRTGGYLAERVCYREAESLLERALRISEQEQRAEHLNTARDAGTLGWLYRAQGRYEQAEPLYVGALAIYEQRLGATYPSTQIIRANYASLLQRWQVMRK